MFRIPQRLIPFGVACASLVAAVLALWAGATDSSEAQPGSMHNCPPAGKWSIAVWEGESGTLADDALATCGADAVVAAYSLDSATGAWSRWFAGKPDLSNLAQFNDLQGVLALGSATGPVATPAATAMPQPTPAGAASTFGDGTHIVGTDIAAGTYRNSSGASGCYWERLSGFGGSLDEILANGLSDDRQIVTILDTDVGFSSKDCGTWSQGLSAITASPTAPFGDGMYLVNVDIAPGTWRNQGASGCYWARLSGFTGEMGEIIANGLGDQQQIVTIGSTDAGFEARDCGTWSKVQ
jgi:hypothetical protein